MDWLVVKLRPIRKQNTLGSGLNSDYLKSEIRTDPKNLVSLLQFINYAQSLDYQTIYMDDIAYRKVTFKVRNFLEYQNPMIQPTNQYQLAKIKDFFQQLQIGTLITSFSNTKFQSLIAVPRVEFEKCPKQKYLIGNVWMVQDLFYYQYPFYLPNLFQKKLSRDEFRVRFRFVQVFSSINLEKEFLIKKFIDTYPSTISNQQKNYIKAYFIEVVQILKQQDIIDDNYKTISKGRFYSTKELTISNISEGFVIYEKLSIK